MRQGSLILAAGCVSSYKKNRKTKHGKKSRPTENTPRNPHQPSDRDHFETDREEMRPARLPMLTRFRRPRIYGNRPRTALAISKNDDLIKIISKMHPTNLAIAPKRIVLNIDRFLPYIAQVHPSLALRTYFASLSTYFLSFLTPSLALHSSTLCPL